MAIWTIDVAHSTIQFSVRYLVISTVTGYFTKFDARVETENDDFENAKIFFFAEINSITTHNEERDRHLKSEDFFFAHNYPRLYFRGSSFQKIDDKHYKLVGNLNIRNYTKSISLDVIFGGIITDMQGHTRAGFEITGKISRKEFGLMWDAVTETGGIMVGDEIKLNINAQFKKILATTYSN